MGWSAFMPHMCRMVSFCTARLPPGKPRYVMGIGYPLDIVICSALGADMYDSVYPTRTARFGVALVPEGVLKLKSAACANDSRCSSGARGIRFGCHYRNQHCWACHIRPGD